MREWGSDLGSQFGDSASLNDRWLDPEIKHLNVGVFSSKH